MINSKVHEKASVGVNCKVINSIIDAEVALGDYNLFAYSEIGIYSYTGEFCHITSAKIGRYCSLSWNVTIGPGLHNYNLITAHPLLAVKRFGFVDQALYNQYDKESVVGNDVWIGCNAVIMRGVTIGDGAVIGANSVVTKDVPPYAIVVGSPARIIKYRFSAEIIKELLDLRWWNLSFEAIKQNIELFSKFPTLESLREFKNKCNE